MKSEESVLFNKCRESKKTAILEEYINKFPEQDNCIKVRVWYLDAVAAEIESATSIKDKFSIIDQKIKYADYSRNNLLESLLDFWTHDVIETLRKKRESIKEVYVESLKQSCGVMTAKDYAKLFEDDVLEDEDYKQIGITREEVRQLQTLKVETIKADLSPLSSEKNYHLPNGSTEIYFWGMPSSGKTCCLGAMLSYASSVGINVGASNFEGDSTVQGNVYFDALKNVFVNDGSMCPLVSSTNESSIAYSQFEFLHPKFKRRKMCFIDLAGETFKSMYLAAQYSGKHSENGQSDGVPLDETKQLCLKVTTDFLLDDRNRKLHFFLIPYTPKGSNAFINKNSLSMSDYLLACSRYLRNKKVFKKSTDGIYIIVTKADLMGESNTEKMDSVAKQYIKDNFKAFYYDLNDLCRQNGIGQGEDRVHVLAFSIGDMLTRDVCRFNVSGAQRLVDLLCQKSEKVATRWGKIWDAIFKF